MRRFVPCDKAGKGLTFCGMDCIFYITNNKG